VTEVERAEQVAREPRRRFKQNIALVAAVLAGLGLFLVLWHETQTRAETAETSAVSLAEQVQERCESEGSLVVADRDLCKRADAVVQGIPVAGPAGPGGPPGPQGERGFTGAQGIQGRTGPGPTAAQIAAAVDDWCSAGMCRGEAGDRGQAGVDSTVAGPQGSQGEPGQDSTVPGPAGPAGQDGEDGADSTIPGPQGIRGPQGTAKPGTYACPDGEFMTGFTVDPDGAVTLACQDPIPPVIETP
jgi:hypothetical protein